MRILPPRENYVRLVRHPEVVIDSTVGGLVENLTFTQNCLRPMLKWI